MKPEEIQGRDFLVGLRGYDKDEVRSFLAEVAAEHAAVLADLEAARDSVAIAPTPTPVAASPAKDDFENLGASVAAILRTAKDSAGEITGDAEARAASVRAEAEEYVTNVRHQADELRARASEQADEVRQAAGAAAAELRAAAQQSLDDAHAEAERIVREATERARAIEIETEARLNNAAEEAARRESALRSRLLEANDELQLALMALGEGPKAEEIDVRDEQPVESTDSHESHDEHAWQ